MADATTTTASDSQKAARWILALGIVMIVAGFLAVLAPGPAALAASLFFAAMFIVGGAAEIAYAVATRTQEGFGWKLLSGIAMVILGVLFATFPLAGIATLALLVGGLLLAHGVASVMLAFRLKPMRAWGWVLFDGVLSIVLALLIAIGWPATSIEIIGLLTGFSLISAGFWRIMLARALREVPPVTT
jgi:uncharacterized membrane protein HdeD (DUF308 family)